MTTTFTEEEREIDSRHSQEIRDLIDAEGVGFWQIEKEKVRSLLERQRLEWVAYVERRDSTPSGGGEKRQPKQQAILAFVALNAGRQFTVEALQEASGCARGTAYSFISDNAGMFRKISRGLYEITTEGAERAATLLGATAAVSRITSDSTPAVTTATTESDIATAAIAAMTEAPS